MFAFNSNYIELFVEIISSFGFTKTNKKDEVTKYKNSLEQLTFCLRRLHNFFLLHFIRNCIICECMV